MSDSIDTHAKLTAGQFIMEGRKRASEQAEHGGHRWHLIFQILLFAIVVAMVGVGYEFHVNELFFVAGGTVIVMLASYAHSRFFSGYYSIYCREWERANEERQRADKLTVECDKSLAREAELKRAAASAQADRGNVPHREITFAEEQPAGAIDGMNTVFTLAHTPIVPGALTVFLNGLRQRAGSDYDYVLSGTTITFNAAPEASDSITATYTW